jgi:hypothetical protein
LSLVAQTHYAVTPIVITNSLRVFTKRAFVAVQEAAGDPFISWANTASITANQDGAATFSTPAFGCGRKLKINYSSENLGLYFMTAASDFNLHISAAENAVSIRGIEAKVFIRSAQIPPPMQIEPILNTAVLSVSRNGVTYTNGADRETGRAIEVNPQNPHFYGTLSDTWAIPNLRWKDLYRMAFTIHAFATTPTVLGVVNVVVSKAEVKVRYQLT